jgi:predicted acyltransferase
LCNGGIVRDWSQIRFAGIFQQFAVCYLVASALDLSLPPKFSAALCPLLLAAYWSLLMFVPFSGHHPGDLSIDGNLAAIVDQQLLPGRKYFGTWDPQGLLTTLPALALTLFGTLIGRFVFTANRGVTAKAVMLLGAGLLLLNGSAIWNWWLPYNPHLWTPSFAILAAACVCMAAGAGLFLLDDRQWQAWGRPLAVFGRNALVVIVAFHILPLDDFASRFVGGDIALFLQNLAATVRVLVSIALVWLLATWLDRKNLTLSL